MTTYDAGEWQRERALAALEALTLDGDRNRAVRILQHLYNEGDQHTREVFRAGMEWLEHERRFGEARRPGAAHELVADPNVYGPLNAPELDADRLREWPWELRMLDDGRWELVGPNDHLAIGEPMTSAAARTWATRIAGRPCAWFTAWKDPDRDDYWVGDYFGRWKDAPVGGNGAGRG